MPAVPPERDPALPAPHGEGPAGNEPAFSRAYFNRTQPREQRLKFRLANPRHGWLEVEVTEGAQRFCAQVSCTPNDFVSDLAAAGCLISQGVRAVASASPEPGYFDFVFQPDDPPGWIRFEIVRRIDHRLVRGSGEAAFSIRASIPEVCSAIWRGLRRLASEVPDEQYQAAIRHPFPSSAVARLGTLLKGPD